MVGSGLVSQLLFISPSERLAEPAVASLRAKGHEVTRLRAPAEAAGWLSAHRAEVTLIDLCVGDQVHAAQAGQLLDRLQGGANGPGPVLVLVPGRGEDQLRSLFGVRRLTNFLAYGDDEAVDATELATTVSKLLTGQIFGLERYLGEGMRRRELRVQSSNQKRAVLEELEGFAREAGCHPLVAEGLAVAGDELLTNALYNAPVDSAGRPRFASWARTREVVLQPGEEIRFSFGFDGRKLGLCAEDPFGTLRPDRILDYLARCFARGKDQIDQKEGGAGLGLFTLFNLVHHYVVNIAPGARTEAIGLVEVSRSWRQHNARGRSFNLFLQRG